VTSKPAGGFSKGSGFRFVVSSPDSEGDGFGFLANAGQYRNWNCIAVTRSQQSDICDSVEILALTGTPCRVWTIANSVLEKTRLCDCFAATNALDTRVCRGTGKSRVFIFTNYPAHERELQRISVSGQM
jgi:hypothetical protein